MQTSQPIAERLAEQTELLVVSGLPIWTARSFSLSLSLIHVGTLQFYTLVKLLPPFPKPALTINNTDLHFKEKHNWGFNLGALGDLFLIFTRPSHTFILHFIFQGLYEYIEYNRKGFPFRAGLLSPLL